MKLKIILLTFFCGFMAGYIASLFQQAAQKTKELENDRIQVCSRP